eukprot:scaffold1110_cov254-Pinguiococcus_pyrenoidosus.AAC.7
MLTSTVPASHAWPAGQTSGEAIPSRGQYVPGGQTVEFEEPRGQYVPFSHGKLSGLLPLDDPRYFPSGQGSDDIVPFGQNDPAGHSWPTYTGNPGPSQKYPLGQSRQCARLNLEVRLLKRPTGQSMQPSP